MEKQIYKSLVHSDSRFFFKRKKIGRCVNYLKEKQENVKKREIMFSELKNCGKVD